MKLFSTGEQGVYFDPNNTATLFEDAAGTIPTALERPVGLMLDQSNGLVLGPELVTNGDFSNGTTGWGAGSGTISASAGALSVVTSGAANGGRGVQALTFVFGKTYKVTGTIVSAPSSIGGLRITPQSDGSSTGALAQIVSQSAGTYSFIFTANTTTLYIALLNSGTNAGVDTVVFDNISVRELPGNHATSSSTARPTLTRRVNLLTNTEAFDNAYWGTQTSATTVSANTSETTDPLGGNTADKLIATIANAFHQKGSSALSVTAGSPVTLSISAKAGGYDYFQLGLTASNTFAKYASVVVKLSDGTNAGTGGQVGGWTIGVPSITPQGNGWYRIQITVTPDSSVSTAFVFLNVSNSATIAPFAGDGTSGIYIWGADLRPANFGVGLPAYQRVGDTAVNAADYDTAGFPAWLRCSGGQSMVTPSINFTGTDKMTVWAGVRKLSDSAAYQVITDLSTSGGAVNNTFTIATNVGTYDGFSKGTVLASASASGYPAPITNVIADSFDISGDRVILRVNGTQAAISTADQGSDNFGNYPLYLFARNQSSLFFNGLAGPIIVRGAQSSAAEIANAENWINLQQKVY